MAVCRFCHKHDDEDRLLKYGVRHYAHSNCFFEAGHTIDELHDWQIREIPYLILKKRGLLEHRRVKAVAKQIDAEIAAQMAEVA